MLLCSNCKTNITESCFEVKWNSFKEYFHLQCRPRISYKTEKEIEDIKKSIDPVPTG